MDSRQSRTAGCTICLIECSLTSVLLATVECGPTNAEFPSISWFAMNFVESFCSMLTWMSRRMFFLAVSKDVSVNVSRDV